MQWKVGITRVLQDRIKGFRIHHKDKRNSPGKSPESIRKIERNSLDKFI
jgi:hypothetical protein